jgi:NTP pyrophosphatase (non-canonical NTP hydrolase)
MPVHNDFVNNWRRIEEEVHQNARDKGFWKGETGATPTKIALIHSEVSEALEAWRKRNPVSKKIAPHSEFAEELADAVIRIMDLARASNLDLGLAIIEKIRFNKTREYQHGGKLI